MVCRSFAAATSLSSARITSRGPYSHLSPVSARRRSPTSLPFSSLSTLGLSRLTPPSHTTPYLASRPYFTPPPVRSTDISPLPLTSAPIPQPPSLTPPIPLIPYTPLSHPAYLPSSTHSRPIPLIPSPPPRDFPRIPADDPRSPAMKWLAFGWRYFLFLMRGFKVTWRERGEVKGVRERVYEGGLPLSWKEDLKARRVKIDLAKLPLMVAITLISDEIIPLILWLFPAALPSTFLLPSQHENLLAKRHKALFKARHTIYQSLLAESPNPEDGVGRRRFDAGWNGDGYFAWSDEDIRAVLDVYGVSSMFYMNRGMLENRIRKKLTLLVNNDDMLHLQPVDEGQGLAREEFITALTERGILAHHLPPPSLPLSLDAYLSSSRSSPSFTPLSYLLDQILLEHPAELEAHLEAEKLKEQELEKERAENGGWTGWKAGVRRWFVTMPSTTKGVEGEGVKVEGESGVKVEVEGGEKEKRL